MDAPGGTVGPMKALLRLLLASLVALTAAAAHAQRTFEPAELEALLAPIALYPDPLLSQILDASQYPQDVQTAAAWSRANPQLSGDAALATVQGTAWPPSVKALVAYPEVLQRMVESPKWLYDLGQAYATYGPNVMATVQDLRARAQAAGYLQSNDQQYVYQQGDAIVVQPVYPNLVYAPYYDPYLVYGGFAWTVFRPVYWRPWAPRPIFVTRVVVAPAVRWYVYPHAHRFITSAPAVVHSRPTFEPFRPVPESRRPPFVHSDGRPFIHSGGQPFIHSGGSTFIRSAPAAVRSAPAPRANVHSGFTPVARSMPMASIPTARGGEWHGGRGWGGNRDGGSSHGRSAGHGGRR